MEITSLNELKAKEKELEKLKRRVKHLEEVAKRLEANQVPPLDLQEPSTTTEVSQRGARNRRLLQLLYQSNHCHNRPLFNMTAQLTPRF